MGFHIGPFGWETPVRYAAGWRGKNWIYSLERNYDYLNVNIINKQSQIVDLVCSNNMDKWLVFVDSVALGEKLQKMIRNELKKEENEPDQYEAIFKKDIVFLSAGYKNKNVDARNEVESKKMKIYSPQEF